MGLLSLLFGGGRNRRGRGDEPKGSAEDPLDPFHLGREAAESHRRWLEERSKDP